MTSLRLFSVAALVSLARGHSQILAAFGDSGMSVGFAGKSTASSSLTTGDAH